MPIGKKKWYRWRHVKCGKRECRCQKGALHGPYLYVYWWERGKTRSAYRGKAAHRVIFSSKTGEWETPKVLFNELQQEFRFTLDACATPENAKCRNFFTKKDNSLSKNWSLYKRVWCNPPYGKELTLWVKKAWEEAQKGAVVVCLLPSRTDTKWWHDYCTRGEVRYIRGRLKFGKSQHTAPFASSVVVFRPADKKGKS